ncbi:MAG: aspartyl/asparaginyl beta-hydroxylase domain-containing protein [Croceibacterium sp.]
MQLKRPFAKLPIHFSAEALRAEMDALPAQAWVAHPDGTPGNDAALLVTPGGRLEQGLIGAMGQTEYLRASPYIRQVMTSIGSVWSRSRLMGLAPGATVDPHVDAHYHWRNHWRLHIPVVTNPDVLFTCGGETVHMQPGECWLFDSFRPHDVRNDGAAKRVHLVLDTVGGGQLHELLERAQSSDPGATKFFAPDGSAEHEPQLERSNVPKVMSPWEMRCHVDFLLGHCQPSSALTPAANRLSLLLDNWTAEWAVWGESPERFAAYLALILAARDDLAKLGADNVRLGNGMSLLHCLRQIVFLMAVERPEQARSWGQAAPARSAG